MLSVLAAPRMDVCGCCGKPVSPISLSDDDLPYLLLKHGHAEVVHWSCARRLNYRKQLMTVLVTPETTKDKTSFLIWVKRILSRIGR